METREDYGVMVVPREGVNDDVVRVLEWLAGEGERVELGKAIVVLETAKSTFDLEASRAGYLFPLAEAGTELPVGAPLALLADQPRRPAFKKPAAEPSAEAITPDQVVTKKARVLIEEYGLSLSDFAGLSVVRSEDVEAAQQKRRERSSKPLPRRFRGAELDPDADWDAILQTDEMRQLRELLTGLRRRMKARFNRHVSLGDLLYDRWELAQDYGFGEATSVYDNCLILGDVVLGHHCWVGPHTILDGNMAALRIGDHVDIGSGTHIYTHNTIERVLTGGKAAVFHKPTTIGNCCFIAPQSIVAPGTVIGDHSFVAAGSYVEGSFPPYSYIAGSPAKRVGVVEVQGNRARLRRFEPGEHGA
jgi:acetyltransferase-like isoleucine patch superfamily enzyme